ncbi:hypothetical protein LNV09_20970 [Paucibacter sp. B2R-40]|uniref:hypothetical protein n=1 Tax=Paucibacter sp. B2R-40 TaxID=2893554 RepID=UPI0021E48C37|nr:hypothetical protein [Paucibacter sp. B2R-40]MCV2356620.1 hypothetical protein [Paucibacter sp. B2R-40]
MTFLIFLLTISGGAALTKLGATTAMVNMLWWVVGSLGAVIAFLLGWILTLSRNR